MYSVYAYAHIIWFCVHAKSLWLPTLWLISQGIPSLMALSEIVVCRYPLLICIYIYMYITSYHINLYHIRSYHILHVKAPRNAILDTPQYTLFPDTATSSQIVTSVLTPRGRTQRCHHLDLPLTILGTLKSDREMIHTISSRWSQFLLAEPRQRTTITSKRTHS